MKIPKRDVVLLLIAIAAMQFLHVAMIQDQAKYYIMATVLLTPLMLLTLYRVLISMLSATVGYLLLHCYEPEDKAHMRTWLETEANKSRISMGYSVTLLTIAAYTLYLKLHTFCTLMIIAIVLLNYFRLYVIRIYPKVTEIYVRNLFK